MTTQPVAVITGAARGIGLQTARGLAATHRVALLDLDGTGVRRAAAEIGRGAIAVTCDITSAPSVNDAVSEVVEQCGGIDVVISNAGIATAGTLRHLDPDVVAAQINVNLIGNWRFIHACLPHVLARCGYVLGVASLAAIVPPVGLGAYGSSKAGLEHLLDVAREELAPLGVGVGVAYFSWIDTDMVRGVGRHHPGFERVRTRLPGPLGRALEVEDAAQAIVRAVGQRAPRAFAPRWVAVVSRLRGVVGPLVARAGRSDAAELDAVTAEVVAARGAFAGGLRPDDEASAAAARSVERGPTA